MEAVNGGAKGKDRRKTTGVHASQVGADGTTLYSRSQAAGFLGTSINTLRSWHASGTLKSARRVDGVHLYTREQLEAFARARTNLNGALAAQVFRRLETGASPVSIVIELEADPQEVHRLVESYAQLTGGWLVAGPKGSRRAWEEAYRIGPLTPGKLRRALELVGASDALRAKLLAE